ncbi:MULTISPECIES: alkaline phosphatase family protein [Ralstonia solanacearum species complex]|nr:alkaline phosphatase family protein [Ralstonia solanacearum]EAP73287.1 Phospholipase C [Ralstonia solanacearum UW551]ALF86439.1 Phospholipase C 3 precursor [Ralstonia solanacearum]ATI26032.1 phospholipase [Ralstonia solanacearum]ATJ84825.1 phospholipase [Ralstonia solanacearum]KEI31008.1 phospholipase [Ralstonia solanacearum]
MPPIRRLFVLMLENRSYDNIFGWSDLQGLTPDGVPTRADGLSGKPQFVNIGVNGNACSVDKDAPYQLNVDLGHEFLDVLVQMSGNPDAAMSKGQYPTLAASANALGFAYNLGPHAADAFRCFTPEQLPVLNFLAGEFAVCDRWFASMPGPTWPNRFFALAGTSWGLDHSPGTIQTVEANLFDGARFGNGSDTLFTRLTPQEWLIAYGDTPQSWSLKGIERSSQRFLHHQELINALRNGQLDASFIFIEPTYDPIGHFSSGQSMHPCGDVRKGEVLVASIYNAIRESRYWEESVLLIVFDEHGGFFDHVIPDDTVVPASQRLASASPTSLTQYGFRFDRYGFRVPAIVVSPYIKAGTIDHTFYDHAAIAKTLAPIVRRQKPPLLTTQRFAQANDFWRVLTLREPRRNIDPCPAVSAPHLSPASIRPPSQSVAAFGTINWPGGSFYGGA